MSKQYFDVGKMVLDITSEQVAWITQVLTNGYAVTYSRDISVPATFLRFDEATEIPKFQSGIVQLFSCTDSDGYTLRVQEIQLADGMGMRQLVVEDREDSFITVDLPTDIKKLSELVNVIFYGKHRTR